MIVNKNLFHTIHKSKLCSKCVKNHSLFFNNAEIFSCEGAALEVLISLCLSVIKLKFSGS